MTNIRLPVSWLLLSAITCTPLCEAGVQLRGVGASFPYPAYKAWIQSFKNFRLKHATVNITYKSTGSGTGQRMILSDDQSVEYAGSDSLLSKTDWEKKPDLLMFPALAGGTVLGYNIPECESNSMYLNLTRDHIVGIFNGTYAYWNDSSLTEVNAECHLPAAKIKVIARADKSGTTNMFTTALSSFSGEWNTTYGIFSDGIDAETGETYHWNKSNIYLFGRKTRGVGGLILSIKYTIGYLSVADALEASITYATLQNKKGHFVRPTSQSIQVAMNEWSKSSGVSLTGTLSDQPHPDAYPIAGFTYLIAYKTQMDNCLSAKELARYILWFMTDESAQEACESVSLVPLSEKLVQKNIQNVLKKMECHGSNVWELVQADIKGENKVDTPWLIPVVVSVPIFMLILGVLLGYILYQRQKLMKMIDNDEWDIPIEDIIFFLEDKVMSGKVKSGIMKSMKSFQNIEEIPEGSDLLDQILQWPGKWKGYVIGIRILEMVQMDIVSRDMKKLLLTMRDSIIHTNVVRFFGLTNVENEKYVIGEYCGKGQMTDVLQNDKYNLTNDFKCSLMTDIANGMNFLHSHGVVHGNLSSLCCLIDSKWTVKVADWEYCKMYKRLYPNDNPLKYVRKDPHFLSKHMAVFRDFWVAPEIIRSGFDLCPSFATDVYSFSVIVQEIFTREDPYVEHADALSPEDILRAVVNNGLRPQPSDDTPLPVRQIMEISWADNPTSRPNFEQIIKMARQSRSSRKSMLDAMMESMEEYTSHLEERVEERTAELTIAKKNLEVMMKDFVPSYLVKKIANGMTIKTTIHNCLGVVMVQISNMNILSECNSPKDVVQYLHCIYTAIESSLSKRNICCTHFSSDSFVVLVGLDKRIISRTECAEVAAHVALDIAVCSRGVKRPMCISAHCLLRLCAHVGGVSTGVIGSPSPKFVILGRTINLAKALLYNSSSTKICISTSMYESLGKKSIFNLEKGKDISYDGKVVETFWLNGRDVVIDVTSDISGHEAEKHSPESQISHKSSSTSNDSVVDPCISDDQSNPIEYKLNYGYTIAWSPGAETEEMNQSPYCSVWTQTPDKRERRSKKKTSKNKVHPTVMDT